MSRYADLKAQGISHEEILEIIKAESNPVGPPAEAKDLPEKPFFDGGAATGLSPAFFKDRKAPTSLTATTPGKIPGFGGRDVKKDDRNDIGAPEDPAGGPPEVINLQDPSVAITAGQKPAGKFRNVTVTGNFHPAEIDAEAAAKGILANEAERARLLERQAQIDDEWGIDPEAKGLLDAAGEVLGPDRANQLLDEFLPDLRDRFDNLESDIAGIMSTAVNPIRIFENGGGVSAALNVAAGTLSQAILGPGSQNVAGAIIQSALDRDFTAQVANKKLGIQAAGLRGQVLNSLQGTLRDELAVGAAMRGLQAQVLAEQALILRGKISAEHAKVALDKIIAGLQAKSQALMRQARGRVGSQGLKVTIAKLVQGETGPAVHETFSSLAGSSPFPTSPGQVQQAAPATRPARVGGGVSLRRQGATGRVSDTLKGDPYKHSTARALESTGLTFKGGNSDIFFNLMEAELAKGNAPVNPALRAAKTQEFMQGLKNRTTSRSAAVKQAHRAAQIYDELADLSAKGSIKASLFIDADVGGKLDALLPDNIKGKDGKRIIELVREARRIGANTIIPIEKGAQDRGNIGRFSDRDLQLLTGQIVGPLQDFKNGQLNLVGPVELREFAGHIRGQARKSTTKAWLSGLGLEGGTGVRDQGEDAAATSDAASTDL